MGIVVGGEKAWKVRAQKDLVVAFHWVNDEPAMVLFPQRHRLGAAAFILCLSAAYKYAKSDGYPTPYCLQQALVAAGVMGMDTTRETARNIAEVILDNLADLVAMPPQPTGLNAAQQKAVGEVTLFSGGRKIAEAEVIDAPDLTH